MATTTNTTTLQVDGIGPVELTVAEQDHARTFLLLHGGGGAATMAAFAELLAGRTGSRVLLPTHPGFGGTPKPAGLAGVTELARTYAALLDQRDLTDVTVIGNSFGGWLAAEIALLHSRRVSCVVIVDGVGIEVEGHPLTDVSGLAPAELRALSFHDPAKVPAPPAAAAPARARTSSR